jgi:hypothetical protein
MDLHGLGAAVRKPAHIAPEADFLAGTRFKSGGGGIRTLDPPNDG